MVTGNGWYLTKHAATVLASAPREAGGEMPMPEGGGAVPEDTHSTDPVQGRGTLEAYTVVFDREGAPERGIVVGRTDEGRRFVANTPEDRKLLEDFVKVEEVGRAGLLRREDDRNLFFPE
jgi:acetyl-CoA C-acetyltransferase